MSRNSASFHRAEIFGVIFTKTAVVGFKGCFWVSFLGHLYFCKSFNFKDSFKLDLWFHDIPGLNALE
jgi:hypothetical protein